MWANPDDTVLWEYGMIKLNATIVSTWVVMVLMVVGAKAITHKLSVEQPRSRLQNVLEVIVIGTMEQIREVGLEDSRRFLGFIGTIFLFVSTSALLTVFPYYEPPTGSLSTTIALALCVFVAIPIYGVRDQGVWGYLKSYVEPTVIMLPFNIIGELSRTMALAMRLFGNMMSGGMIVGVLLTLTPLFVPAIMTAFGLLTGVVQAYIFSILAGVYIAAAVRSHTTSSGRDPA